MIHIGDIIEVTRWGDTYDAHESKASQLGATNWKYGHCPGDGDVGRIVNFDRFYTLVRMESGFDIVIDVNGVKVIESIIRAGTTVRVINNGKTYPRYDSKARELGAVNWDRDVNPLNSSIGVVKARKNHHVLIDIDGMEYIVGAQGLQPIEEMLRIQWEELLEEFK